MKRILMAALVPAMIVGCSEANKPQLTNSENSAQLFQQDSANLITIKSMDDKAVANAQVLIGDAQNSPFAGNL
jgi:PBP1b-binding outer membrane lipoprotein LpoB